MLPFYTSVAKERRSALLTLTFHTDSQSRVRRWLTVALATVLIGAAIHYALKAADDRSAIMRWRPLLEQLVRGEDVYSVGSYPNPPLLGILLYPLTLLPPILAALTWFLLKVTMAALSVRWALAMTSAPGQQGSTLVTAVVVLLSSRPLLGDLQHGNVNILIFFLVAAGLWSYRQRRDWLAGLCIALATTFKVTPALFVPYFAYKGQWRVVGWSCLGLGLFLFVFPALILGPQHNLELLAAWSKLMIAPYVLHGVVDTTQVNQSLPGLFLRLFTASPGLELEGGELMAVNWLSLDPQLARIMLKAIILSLLGWLAFRK